MSSARPPKFYELTPAERIEALITMRDLSASESELLRSASGLSLAGADKMVENVVGVYGLPFGLGLNFLINGRDYVVPMAIEEPSVVASASFAAKTIRINGGFTAHSTERMMIGQIQVVGCPDVEAAAERLMAARHELLLQANAFNPSMVERGGGARELEVRILKEGASAYGRMLVLHLLVDTKDAMGANTINTMVEGLAPEVERLTEGKVYLRILSNYTDRCLASAQCVIPAEVLATPRFTGPEVIEGILQAYAFAAADPYRAVTHNKGVMNGIDAVIIATGNDWRAVEAAVHAYAAREGEYRPLTHWSKDEAGNLVGKITVPMAAGTVGGSIQANPMARLALRNLGGQSAGELGEVVAAAGLAQNFAALRALVTDGIQKGHMALHARSVALSAGAEGAEVDVIARRLVRLKEIKVSKAKELLLDLKKQLETTL
ncbi:MAG: hydroxymethylglutaryl-CoA reductase, degradative [Candidatus Sericytochromatia bacterium]|nr:hydroxymethylglutaryl-CoA reductase, degradative [Candidatus Sericytochromatia bacterium]